jgi:hypothetical protein
MQLPVCAVCKPPGFSLQSKQQQPKSSVQHTVPIDMEACFTLGRDLRQLCGRVNCNLLRNWLCGHVQSQGQRCV